jgi:hypothetical protein
MLFIGFRIGVTRDASEYGKIIWVDVAIITLIPYSLMLTAIDREMLDIMIEGSGFPCDFAMAGSAVRSKS